jgi:hypothetical protein
MILFFIIRLYFCKTLVFSFLNVRTKIFLSEMCFIIVSFTTNQE